MNVQIINKSKHATPNYETEGSAGMDLRANIEETITLKPLERAIVKTGLFIALPVGFEAQVRPRSGLAAKKGITVLNAPGTIDPDYRGEVKVLLANLGHLPFDISKGDRIAQLVFSKYETPSFNHTSISHYERGEEGFGSTGTTGNEIDE